LPPGPTLASRIRPGSLTSSIRCGSCCASQTRKPGSWGVLHDVLEDTTVTREELLAEGFSRQALEALDAVTRRPGEPFEALIRRAAAHPIVRQVKIADLMDNLDPERLARLPASEGAGLRAKYQAALAILRPTTG
jgi:hypothetical protein